MIRKFIIMFAHTHTHTHTLTWMWIGTSDYIHPPQEHSVFRANVEGHVDTMLAQHLVEKDHYWTSDMFCVNFKRVLDALHSFLTLQSTCLYIQRFQRRTFEIIYTTLVRQTICGRNLADQIICLQYLELCVTVWCTFQGSFEQSHSGHVWLIPALEELKKRSEWRG